MADLRKYNVAATILFTLIVEGAQDFFTGTAPVAGDVKIIKDEGASANTTNLPVHEGNGMWSLLLTATEMSAARVTITIIDATATKIFEDQMLVVDTYGNASAQHALDLDTIIANQVWDELVADHLVEGSFSRAHALDAGTAQGGTAFTITLRSGFIGGDGLLDQCWVVIIGGKGVSQTRYIEGYVSSTKVATITPIWHNIPDATSLYYIFPAAGIDIEGWRNAKPNVLVSARVDADVGAKTGNVPLSIQEKLDINTEADTALTDYDGPTNAEMDTAHALLATEAKQDLIDTVVDAIKAVTDLLPDAGALSDLAAILIDTGTTLQAELDGIQADTEDLQARTPAALIGGRVDATVGAVQANAIGDTGVDPDLDSYQGKVWIIDDDGTGNDRYAITFFKNGKQITAGVTVPTMWVYSAAASPVDLVGTSASPQALTEAGTTETWFHNEGANRILDGVAYFARVRFTVDGSEREWTQPIGRDSVV